MLDWNFHLFPKFAMAMFEHERQPENYCFNRTNKFSLRKKCQAGSLSANQYRKREILIMKGNSKGRKNESPVYQMNARDEEVTHAQMCKESVMYKINLCLNSSL